MNSTIDRSAFEEIFGTDEEWEAMMAEAKARDERHEHECRDGKRQRCKCGEPSIFVHEQHGPMCAPCGYGCDFGE